MTVFAMAMGLPNAPGRLLGKGPWRCCQGRWTWTWASKTGSGGGGKGERREKRVGRFPPPVPSVARIADGSRPPPGRVSERAGASFSLGTVPPPHLHSPLPAESVEKLPKPPPPFFFFPRPWPVLTFLGGRGPTKLTPTCPEKSR